MRAGKIILFCTAATAIGAVWALARVNRDTDPVLTFGEWPRLDPEMVGVKAPAIRDYAGGGRRKTQQGPSVTNGKQQTTHSNSPIKSGQVAD